MYEESLIRGNMTKILEEVRNISHPIVGLRSKDNEDWWSYPIVVVYLAIDRSLEGKKGKICS